MTSVNKKNIKLTQRTPAEKTLLLLSALAFIFIFPFIFIRIASGNWQVAIVDTIISIVMLGFFAYVYITRKVNKARLTMSLLFMAAILIDIALKGSDLLYWFYPAIIVLYYLNNKKVALLLTTTSTVILTLVLYSYVPIDKLATIVVTAVVTNIFSFLIFNSYHKINKKLEAVATTDELTSTLNRRALNTNMIALVSEQSRLESPVCLLLLDLDKFKSVNDQYGHIIGDEVLIAVAKVIAKQTRSYELLYRYGGEEFLIAPIKYDLTSAKKFAERLRALVEQSPFPSDIKLTISIGVAQYQQGETVEQWISRADSALYQAKNTGRNRACVAEKNDMIASD